MANDKRPTLPGEGIAPAATPPRPPAQGSVETTKRYTVVGPRPVHGAAPGSDVTLTLTADQEEHLISVGHLKISTR